MSNAVNQALLERAQEAIDLAHDHAEFWCDTTTGKMIDATMAQVIKDIDDNDLELLYEYSLPALNQMLLQSAIAMGQQSQEYFHDAEIL